MKVSVNVTLKSGVQVRLNKTCADQQACETFMGEVSDGLTSAGTYWHQTGFDDSQEAYFVKAEVASVDMGIWT